jgi:hypothetical protein
VVPLFQAYPRLALLAEVQKLSVFKLALHASEVQIGFLRACGLGRGCYSRGATLRFTREAACRGGASRDATPTCRTCRISSARPAQWRVRSGAWRSRGYFLLWAGQKSKWLTSFASAILSAFSTTFSTTRIAIRPGSDCTWPLARSRLLSLTRRGQGPSCGPVRAGGASGQPHPG